MLVATPFRGGVQRAPRIISEVRKTPDGHVRARISGELLVLIGAERRWLPRKVLVRAGQLLLAAVPGESCAGMRIPLRQLSLRAGPLPHSLSLIKGQGVLLTLQTAGERAFDLWVKTLAIELIRQTPLDAVKYLDIFALTDRTNNYDCNSNYVVPKLEFGACDVNRNQLDVANGNLSDTDVALLLKKCQSAESYVPVREKLVLFESLCRIGRRAHSSVEDVSIKGNSSIVTKRARSMHDLTYCLSTGGVREICKYFETKLDAQDVASPTNNKRLINSDSNLNKVTFQRHCAFDSVSYA